MQYAHGRFEPRLEVAQHPPRKWFMAGAHNSDHFSFKIVLRTRFLQRGMQGALPLRVHLLYVSSIPSSRAMCVCGVPPRLCLRAQPLAARPPATARRRCSRANRLRQFATEPTRWLRGDVAIA